MASPQRSTKQSGWSARLSRPVGTREGDKLTTLADARRYLLAIKDGREKRNAWQHAAKLLLEAAEGGDVEAATKQVEFALLMEGRLILR